MNTVWVVVEVKGTIQSTKEDVQDVSVFEIEGVFTSEEKAVEACRSEFFCVMPIELDKVAPVGASVIPTGTYYPMQESLTSDKISGFERV